MSETYDLVCDATRQKIWVGQSRNGEGKMTAFYSGESETMKALGRFLMATQGHTLRLVRCSEDGDCEGYNDFYPDHGL